MHGFETKRDAAGLGIVVFYASNPRARDGLSLRGIREFETSDTRIRTRVEDDGMHQTRTRNQSNRSARQGATHEARGKRLRTDDG